MNQWISFKQQIPFNQLPWSVVNSIKYNKKVSSIESEILKQYALQHYEEDKIVTLGDLIILFFDGVGGEIYDVCNDSLTKGFGTILGDCDVNDSSIAFFASLFPAPQEWDGIQHSKGENPFQPLIELWNRGFVVSYHKPRRTPDVHIEYWFLHSGKKGNRSHEVKIKTN